MANSSPGLSEALTERFCYKVSNAALLSPCVSALCAGATAAVGHANVPQCSYTGMLTRLNGTFHS